MKTNGPILIDAKRLPLREETVYIVFDLEWNQCPYGKDFEDPALPFEIIDIGAIKLSKDLEVVDSFHCFVKPAVYKKLHFRTREVIGFDRSELQKGVSFPEAARDFFAFCGTDYIFCTWGDTDLTELERNLQYYDMLDFLHGPFFFEDVQKLFAVTYEDRRKRRSLEYAVDFLSLADSRVYHRAFDDAAYTAKILAKIPEEIILSSFSVDTYQHPQTKEAELRLRCEGYEKYISREFSSKEAAMQDREVRALRCPSCGKNAKRTVNWMGKNGRYVSLGSCKMHGSVYGRIRTKRGFDDSVYVEKVIRPVSEEEAEELIPLDRRK